MSTGQGNGKDIDISSKYQVEINSKFNKQGSNSGNNTKETILNIIQQQSNNQKKGE